MRDRKLIRGNSEKIFYRAPGLVRDGGRLPPLRMSADAEELLGTGAGTAVEVGESASAGNIADDRAPGVGGQIGGGLKIILQGGGSLQADHNI